MIQAFANVSGSYSVSMINLPLAYTPSLEYVGARNSYILLRYPVRTPSILRQKSKPSDTLQDYQAKNLCLGDFR